MGDYILKVQPLEQATFATYGDVIECAGKNAIPVNNGMAQRFNDLAMVDTKTGGGKTLISLFTSKKYTMPHRVEFVERHPLGSQAFMPLSSDPFLVVVAPAGDTVDVNSLQAFISNGQQGINYHKGVWHHVLLTPNAETTFLCVDRGGDGNNCEELPFAAEIQPLLE